MNEGFHWSVNGRGAGAAGGGRGGGGEGAVGIVSNRFVFLCVLVLVFVPFSVRGGTWGCR